MASYTTIPISSATEPKPKTGKRFVACAAVASFVLGALAATALSADRAVRQPNMALHKSDHVVEKCCPGDVCGDDLAEYIPPFHGAAPLGCPTAALLTPSQFAHRASAHDGRAHAWYAADDRPLYKDGGHFTYDKKKDVFKFAYYGSVHGVSDEVEYLYKRAAPKGDQVKLWKKSCGDNCPGFYKVYMNCEGHFGGGGMGPHCYLQFWCTKSNTDDTYDDC